MNDNNLNYTTSKIVSEKKPFFEYLTTWIGSIPSLVVHTLLFISAFVVGYLGIAEWDTVLLVLTTIVSLEAIYLSIFIQMTVNRHTASLKEVEEDVEDIQEDLEEISEDLEDIQEDVEELNEEDAEDEARQQKQMISLDVMSKELRQILDDLEKYKKQ